MRKRSTEILEKLILSNSKSMEVKKLITTYRISLKTLRTDVNEINDFLLEAKMSPTKLNEKEKLILLEKDIMKIQDRLNHMDTYSYKMSREERQIYIIAELLMSQDYITMQNLAKKLNVSRNTILNDFETVKDYCLAFNVNVLMKSSKGNTDHTFIILNEEVILFLNLFIDHIKCFLSFVFHVMLHSRQ